MLKRRSVSNIFLNLLFVVALAVLAYWCYKLFGWMLINFERQYRSDIPAYIAILESRPHIKTRLIYVLFRFLLNLTKSELGINIFLASVVVVICIANNLYIRYYSSADMSKGTHLAFLNFTSIAIIFAGPIYIPHIHAAFYKNTFPIFAWQSPTQQLLTLFSILATITFFKMLDDYESGISALWWITSAVFFFLSAYSKPNYMLDIAPAVVIVFLIELVIKGDLSLSTKFKRLFIMGASLIPACIYIVGLYIYIYSKPDTGEVVLALTNPNSATAPNVIVTLICSMLFPLIVFLFNIKKISSDRRYRLILTISLMGLLQWGLLSESGWRSSHGNFSWGCMIGNYMLMLTSVGMALQNYCDEDFLKSKSRLRLSYYFMLTLSFAAHFVSSAYYFYRLYNGAGFWR